MSQKLELYRNLSTLNKSAAELIVMVYDGAIDNLQNAAKMYQNEELQTGYEAIEKAKRFIVHLYTTLDETKGGDIAVNLSKMYAHLIDRMNLVQATKDIKIIEDSVGILQNIKKGWTGLVELEKARQNEKRLNEPEKKHSANLSVSA